jgi:hypothetical protein
MSRLVLVVVVVVLALSTEAQAFTGTYASWDENARACNGAASTGFYGREPASGTHTVLVYTHGMWGLHDAAEAKAIVDAAAEAGFVAVSADWNSWNVWFPGDYWDNNARCIYGGLLPRLCARARADCSKGMVAVGFSKGAQIAARAHGRATWLMGYGYDPGVYSRTDLRIVDGEAEGSSRSSLNARTGLSCPTTAFECLRPDGSGWLLVRHGEVADGVADHCWFQDGGCSWNSDFDPGWLSGGFPWSLGPNLDWLKSHTD